MKKKFLLLTQAAYINDVARQLAMEGNDVKYYIGYPPYSDLADGFVTKTYDWKKEAGWADVIIVDAGIEGGTDICRQLRSKGKKVIGATHYTDRLEEDREFGQSELRRKGIKTISEKNFSDFDEAIRFIRKNPGYYVAKPDGDAQDNKSLLFVGEEESGSDVIGVIESYRNNPEVKKFQLQKRIFGVEMAVSAFFNGKKFLDPVNINFEHKKLFPGNIGPSTIEMGTSMFWEKDSSFFSSTLKRFEEDLKNEGYIGVIDLNCIVNAEGVHPLEFTPRFGYPTISIMLSSLDMPAGEFFYKLSHGNDFEIGAKQGFHIGVRVVVPPYPYHCPDVFKEYSQGKKIKFRTKDREGIHIEDVKIAGGEWILSGDVGAALLVTGSGLTMEDARVQAYRRIENVLIPNMYYRNDIGARWHEDIKKLHAWGFFPKLA